MSRLIATYRVASDPSAIDGVAQALALEQSVEVPAAVVADARVRDEVMGRVDAIHTRGDATFDVRIALATATTGSDPAQLLNMLFGNSSLHDHVELVDVDLPPDLLAAFSGPRFGIAGVREALGVEDRALTCAALKPQGLPTERLAALCRTFADGGIDVVKDDHGLADQRYSPFAERVAACQRAVDASNRATGRRAIYAPSLVGSPMALERQVAIARDEGVRMVLVAPALVGMPAFEELVRLRLDVPVLAHPAYAGAARVAPALLLGRIFRLLGADLTIFPNHGGRFAYPAATCAGVADAARSPLGHLRPIMPVPAGGLSVDRVAELLAFYGRDVMLLIGGSLLAAGDRLEDATRAFAASVAAASRQAR